MDKEILEILKQLQVGQQETNKRLINIENEIKDLNAMEVVTFKDWNDIAQLKAIK